jgi:cytochrome c-type biogenesis protein CcmE
MRIPHAKFVFAGALIIGGICYLMFSGISESMVYYYTVSEIKAQRSLAVAKGVRVSGHVLPGSIQKLDNGTRVDFSVFEKSNNESIPVSFSGLIPDTFKDGAEVVVEGTFDPEKGTFDATTLLAKCPSKYEGKADEHPGDYPEAEKAAVQ